MPPFSPVHIARKFSAARGDSCAYSTNSMRPPSAAGHSAGSAGAPPRPAILTSKKTRGLPGRSRRSVMARAALPHPGRLLAHFVTAARHGGGWVRYEWRDSASAPLQMKGAHASLLPVDSTHTAIALVCFGAPTHGGREALAPPGVLPTPPPVAPSRDAVKAAARALQRSLATARSEGEVAAAVSDRDGELAAAAAAALCWEVTDLPRSLSRALNNRATLL